MEKPQEEMQNLGFFGIYKETIKTIFSHKKIFTRISITFIFPLSFFLLTHFVVEDTLDSTLNHDDQDKPYNNSKVENLYLYRKLSNPRIVYWVFIIIYMTLIFLFSILSTATVVYTVANVYSGYNVTFKKVLKFVPKVWRRLAITFLFIYFGFFIYNGIIGLLFYIWASTTRNETTNTNYTIAIFYILVAIYCAGFINLTAHWQLASVVAVLEISCPRGPMRKCVTLIKRKRLLSWFVFFVLYCAFAGILIVFFVFMYDGMLGVIMTLVCVFLLMILFLVGYVAQTMLYLVCKSYHGEPIDKMELSRQLGGDLGQIEPTLKVNKDINELGLPQVQV
ncbi:hypothetical protein QVD17_37668 [Tagetes erecta]|uniref:Uncharacterized protein n=1 Tax=Tagetes erecta TaxID=13708 RepID=A0AAD8NIK5_TARER|nr:hypothetical protein QVD17_37668 [Tagetes erecta]